MIAKASSDPGVTDNRHDYSRRRLPASRQSASEGRADIAPVLKTGQLCKMEHPEARFVVEVTADDEIVCRAPDHEEQRIKIADLAAVYVETNDSGPWGADVWWLLNDNTGQTQVAFPQLAIGENAALERLRRLPGFEVQGMNSCENARFMCWPKPCALHHEGQ